MKKLGFLALMFIFATSNALAQGGYYSNVVLTADPVTGFTRGANGVSIRVCKEPSSGTTTACTPLAKIYQNSLLNLAQSNPFNADSNGNFQFYAAPGIYRIQVVSAGTYTSLLSVPLTNPYSPIGLYQTVPFTVGPTFDASQGGILALTLTGNVTTSSVINPTTSQLLGFQICQDTTGNRTFTWPVNFLLPPTIAAGPSSCTNSVFYFDGTNWHPFITSASSSGGTPVFIGGPFTINASAGLPNAPGTNFLIGGNYGGGVLGRMFVGDGTGGNKVAFSQRSAGVDTDLFTFGDNGQFNTLGTGNGVFDASSNGGGSTGPTNFVRYTGCNNVGCISNNGDGPFNVSRVILNGANVALPTGAIGANVCVNGVNITNGNLNGTESVSWSFNSDPGSVTGYAPGSGNLAIKPVVVSGTFTLKVCNATGASVTPGAMGINYEVSR